MKSASTTAATAAVLSMVLSSAVALAATPADKCEAGKNGAAGKYAACLLKAQQKFVSGGGTDTATYDAAVTTCGTRLADKWQSLEDKYEGMCPSIGDAETVQDFLDSCIAGAQVSLEGGTLPVDVVTCNTGLDTCSLDLDDCNYDFDTCTDDLDTCDTNLASTNADLVECTDDLDTCTADLGTCPDLLDICTYNLNACTSAQCGDGTINGSEQCESGNLDGQTCASLGFAGGTLRCDGGCVFDTSDCYAARFVYNGDGTVSDYQLNLTWERKNGACPAGYVASGTYSSNVPSTGTLTLIVSGDGTTWTGNFTDSSGGPGPCNGTVSGLSFTGLCHTVSFGNATVTGSVDCGTQTVSFSWTLPPTYAAVGSGTVDGDPIHDKNNLYRWSDPAGTAPTGGAFTEFIAELNGASDGQCFAGHCDWRLPTNTELTSILDYSVGCGPGFGPCINQTLFGPTQEYLYWSATTEPGDPTRAYDVAFDSGQSSDNKNQLCFVRAVRSGI